MVLSFNSWLAVDYFFLLNSFLFYFIKDSAAHRTYPLKRVKDEPSCSKSGIITNRLKLTPSTLSVTYLLLSFTLAAIYAFALTGAAQG